MDNDEVSVQRRSPTKEELDRFQEQMAAWRSIYSGARRFAELAEGVLASPCYANPADRRDAHLIYRQASDVLTNLLRPYVHGNTDLFNRAISSD